MKIEETYLIGCYILAPNLIRDKRGLFFESFNQRVFENLTGQSIRFVQDNQSISNKGVLRGLHFQKGEYAQSKLVQVVQGKALDVCVDLRRDSDTFGKHYSIILDDKENKQLFIPKGFAHGFLALENNTIFSYKCDNYYNKASEEGIIYNDETLNIDWGFPESELVLSQKDKALPTFETFVK